MDQGGRVVRPHQDLADEDGVSAGFAHAARVIGVMDAALRDQNHVARDLLAQAFRQAEVHREGSEVPVVDAYRLRAGAQRDARLTLMVDLHQRRQL